MEGLKAELTKKLGPLPTWAWGVIAAGVLAAGLLYYRKRVAADASATPADTTNPTAGTSNLPFVPVAEISGLPPPSTSAPTPPTNALGTIFAMHPPGAKTGQNFTPLYLIPGSDPNKPLNNQAVTDIPVGTAVSVLGKAIPGLWGGKPQSFLPVRYANNNYWVNPADFTPVTAPIPIDSGVNGNSGNTSGVGGSYMHGYGDKQVTNSRSSGMRHA